MLALGIHTGGIEEEFGCQKVEAAIRIQVPETNHLVADHLILEYPRYSLDIYGNSWLVANDCSHCTVVISSSLRPSARPSNAAGRIGTRRSLRRPKSEIFVKKNNELACKVKNWTQMGR